MTRLALIICKYPGCNHTVSPTVGYCPLHIRDDALPPKAPEQQPERTDEQRERHRLYDRKWKKRRAAQLAERPWCAVCLDDGIYTPATDVHHVVPHHGDRGIF